MNLYHVYLFLLSFLLYMRGCSGSVEDVTVRPRGRLAPTMAAVTGAAAVVPGSCLKWSHDFVL
jgi:hypothetical protein